MNKELAMKKFEDALINHKSEFEKFFLVRFFDLKFTYDDETCTVEVPVEDYMYNPFGSLHGGIISFILDASMGHLCNKKIGAAVTLELKTQYLKPVKSGTIKCQASFLKQGRKIVSLESRMTDEAGDLIAIGTATWMRV